MSLLSSIAFSVLWRTMISICSRRLLRTVLITLLAAFVAALAALQMFFTCSSEAAARLPTDSRFVVLLGLVVYAGALAVILADRPVLQRARR
jgi:hypothetical protein